MPLMKQEPTPRSGHAAHELNESYKKGKEHCGTFSTTVKQNAIPAGIEGFVKDPEYRFEEMSKDG